MSNLLEFAKEELRRLRSGHGPDEMQDMIEKHILAMVEMFAAEGHSGGSASYTISILEKVLRFEPVTPLTGEDDEWCILNYDSDMAAQNKRCPHVFKRADGSAYDGQAIVFREPSGACFTSIDSRKEITFPYRPTVEYVDVPGDQAAVQSTPLPFVREWRYIAIKRKHMTADQEAGLLAFLDANGIRQVDCVCVEADWPEYEPVWQMIEARCAS